MTTASSPVNFADGACPMRLPLGFLLSVAMCLSYRTPAQNQSPQHLQQVSPVKINISGPRLTHRGDHLKFNISVTNQSDAPVALRFPRILGDTTTQFIWRITDVGDRLLPPVSNNGSMEGFCPITSGPSDWDIVVLVPHETMSYDYAGDPSDNFAFPGKGFYRVSVKYILNPDRNLVEAPYHVPSDKPENYTPREKIEMSRKMPHLETTSNELQLYLAD
jgi:hypothetical protein